MIAVFCFILRDRIDDFTLSLSLREMYWLRAETLGGDYWPGEGFPVPANLVIILALKVLPNCLFAASYSIVALFCYSSKYYCVSGAAILMFMVSLSLALSMNYTFEGVKTSVSLVVSCRSRVTT